MQVASYETKRETYVIVGRGVGGAWFKLLLVRWDCTAVNRANRGGEILKSAQIHGD